MNTTTNTPKLTPLTNHGDHVTCGAAVPTAAGTEWCSIIVQPQSALGGGVAWHAVAWMRGYVVGSSYLTSSAVGAAAGALRAAVATVAEWDATASE